VSNVQGETDIEKWMGFQITSTRPAQEKALPPQVAHIKYRRDLQEMLVRQHNWIGRRVAAMFDVVVLQR